MAVLLILLGVGGLLFGVVNLVRPTGWLGVSSRATAGWVVVSSVLLLLLGIALSPSEDSGVDPSATATTAPEEETSTTTVAPSTTEAPTTTVAERAEGPFAPPRNGPSGDPEEPLDPSAEVATVEAVTDGDTVDITLPDGSRETVRLIGVNSPERGECWASEATRVLEALIPQGDEIGMTVDESDRDQFGRMLRYLWVGSMSVNEELVRRGAAIARRYPPDTALADRLDAAQEEAETASRGMWASDACGEAADGDLVIVELRYDAEGDDSQNLNDEWIRIRNDGTRAVDLTGWGIKDESASNRFSFTSGFTLSPDAEVTVFSGCGDDTAAALYWCSSGSAIWNNSGDTAFITDPSGNTHTSQSYSP